MLVEINLNDIITESSETEIFFSVKKFNLFFYIYNKRHSSLNLNGGEFLIKFKFPPTDSEQRMDFFQTSFSARICSDIGKWYDIKKDECEDCTIEGGTCIAGGILPLEKYWSDSLYTKPLICPNRFACNPPDISKLSSGSIVTCNTKLDATGQLCDECIGDSFNDNHLCKACSYKFNVFFVLAIICSYYFLLAILTTQSLYLTSILLYACFFIGQTLTIIRMAYLWKKDTWTIFLNTFNLDFSLLKIDCFFTNTEKLPNMLVLYVCIFFVLMLIFILPALLKYLFFEESKKLTVILQSMIFYVLIQSKMFYNLLQNTLKCDVDCNKYEYHIKIGISIFILVLFNVVPLVVLIGFSIHEHLQKKEQAERLTSVLTFQLKENRFFFFFFTLLLDSLISISPKVYGRIDLYLFISALEILSIVICAYFICPFRKMIMNVIYLSSC